MQGDLLALLLVFPSVRKQHGVQYIKLLNEDYQRLQLTSSNGTAELTAYIKACSNQSYRQQTFWRGLVYVTSFP
jgi:hypothetical protein